MAEVSPTTQYLTHDLSLTDGTTTLNLQLANRRGEPDPGGWQKANNPKTSLRMTQGNEGYGDYELPFSSIVQSDFSGGRGNKDFERDTTRYSDGMRCDTNRPNELRCGPLATQGSGYNVVYTSAPETTARTYQTSNSLFAPAVSGYAGCFTPGATISARTLTITYGATGWGSRGLYTVKIYSHDSGNNRPNAVLATATIPVESSLALISLTFDLSIALTAGTKYWLYITTTFPLPTTGLNVQYSVSCYTGASAGNKVMAFNDAGAWVDVAGLSDVTLSFYIQTQGYGRSILFDYRNRKMAVTQSDDLAAPKLWMQGYHGLGKDNAADKSKLNTSLNLSGVDLTGKYARIVSGPGSTEETPWRKIISNEATGANDDITVAPAWNITHTAATEFVIQGCTNWQEITAANPSTSMAIRYKDTLLTAPVTDVLVVDDILYFCQGEGVAVCRTRFNAGVWADMVADGTNMYTFMELTQDDEGVQRIWGAKRAAATINEAAKVAWGTNLTFSGTALVCGDTSMQITGLLPAKLTGEMLPVVFKENEFGAVAGTSDKKIYDAYRKFPEAGDPFNGRAAVQHDMYLWFSLLDGIERYYDQRLDDIGPNRDEGLPQTRKGRVSVMVPYFSQIYAAYDAGRYGYSSIMRWNGTGWCEMYRGAYGKRIRSLNVEVLPDLDNSDRLWFSEEEDIYYIPISLNPDKSDGYQYFTGSEWESAWIYGNYRDLSKYWDSLTIFAENLSAVVTVTAYFKVDNQTAWTALPTAFTASPVQEVNISTARTTVGRRIKIKLVLATNSAAVTPIVSAVRINAVVRVKPKGIWSVTALLVDGTSADLQHTLTEGDVHDSVDKLEAWQDGTLFPAPLTMNFYHAIGDAKRVFVDGVSAQPTMVEVAPGIRRLKMLVSFTLLEV